MNWTRRLLTACTILAVIILLPPDHAPEADAHAPKCRTIAIRQALANPPATPTSVAEYRRACNQRAQRHRRTHLINAATRRCVNVPRSNMTARVCRGLATAAVDRRHTSWAWDPALHELLRRESTWNPNAVNDECKGRRCRPACGLWQILPCPWTYTYGPPERVYASPTRQSKRGIRYVETRYVTPRRALRFHNENGYY